MTDQEKIAIAKKEYRREWRRKNPESIKATNDRFFLNQFNKLQIQKQTT